MVDAKMANDIMDVMTAAIAAGDADRFTSVYADDARVWHNTTRSEQTKVENTAFLKETMQQFSGMEYTDIRRKFTEDGVVQQHVLRATLPSGDVLELPACLIVEFDGGKIKRIDEYFDNPA